MALNKIEDYFLDVILKISLGGILLILLSNILIYPEDLLTITLACIILMTCLLAYILRRSHSTFSILSVTLITLFAMAYQRWVSPLTTTTLSIIMIDGFIISVMLKDRLFWIMHSIAILILIVVFAMPLDDAITAGVTYLTLYFVLVFATYKLKSAYNQVQKELMHSNAELEHTSKALSKQYKDLEDASQNLSSLNKSLEDRVNKRTAKIQFQNQVLLKYNYRNAHHLRGPVARLLGLASVYKLDEGNNPDEFIEKMVVQANEIDLVVKQINVELAENDDQFDSEL